MGDPERNRRGDDLAHVLRKRRTLLRSLADAPLDQRDLRNELGVSRSTVYKSLQELIDLDLVVERDGAYDLTGFGRLVWRNHSEYVAGLNRLEDGRRLIDALPADRWFPRTLFERGQISSPGRDAPDRPLDRLATAGDDAKRIRAVSPSGMPRFLADLHENVEAGEQTATLLVGNGAISRLRSAYEQFPEATRADGLEIRRLDDEIDFAVVLFDDDEVGLFGYNAGAIAGAAFSNDPDAFQWGERRFEEFLERSMEV